MVRRMGASLRRLRVHLVVGLLLPFVAAGTAWAKPGKVDHHRLLLGVNVDLGATPAIGERELVWAARLHAKLVRIDIRWSELEPQPGQLQSAELSALDGFMAAAARHRLHVILMVDSTPCWDSSAPPALLAGCVPGTAGPANAWPPTNDAAYGAFVAFLAKRYAPDLAAIEVWNEPDQANEDYLAGPEKARHYAEILKAAYPAIKAVAPSVLVLGGSFIGPNGNFLRLLYENHIQGYYDALSVHFYTLTVAALQAIHEIQLRYHDPKGLWLAEFGWPSCLPGGKIEQEQPCVTAKVQAENIASLTHSLAHLPYVEAAVLYKLQDSPEELFGVLTEAGRPKPAFRAAKRAFAHPFAKPAPVRLFLHRNGRRLRASGSGPVGDYMVLEAFRNHHRRYRAVFILNRFNRYSLLLPAPLGTRGLVVRVYPYGFPKQGVSRRG
jgi:hypothetical protein